MASAGKAGIPGGRGCRRDYGVSEGGGDIETSRVGDEDPSQQRKARIVDNLRLY